MKRLRDEKGGGSHWFQSTIGDYEPDIQTLTLLADYFETSIDYLVGRTDIVTKLNRLKNTLSITKKRFSEQVPGVAELSIE